jgi:hypothetical protein
MLARVLAQRLRQPEHFACGSMPHIGYSYRLLSHASPASRVAVKKRRIDMVFRTPRKREADTHLNPTTSQPHPKLSHHLTTACQLSPRTTLWFLKAPDQVTRTLNMEVGVETKRRRREEALE